MPRRFVIPKFRAHAYCSVARPARQKRYNCILKIALSMHVLMKKLLCRNKLGQRAFGLQRVRSHMALKLGAKKNARDLTIKDFHTSPIWVETEDDGFGVVRP